MNQPANLNSRSPHAQPRPDHPRRDAARRRRPLALERRSHPTGHALLAERDGVAIAAVGLTSGAVVAHPAQATAPAVRALRLRRYQIMRQGGDVGPLASLLRRLAPAT